MMNLRRQPSLMCAEPRCCPELLRQRRQHVLRTRQADRRDEVTRTLLLRCPQCGSLQVTFPKGQGTPGGSAGRIPSSGFVVPGLWPHPGPGPAVLGRSWPEPAGSDQPPGRRPRPVFRRPRRSPTGDHHPALRQRQLILPPADADPTGRVRTDSRPADLRHERTRMFLLLAPPGALSPVVGIRGANDKTTETSEGS